MLRTISISSIPSIRRPFVQEDKTGKAPDKGLNVSAQTAEQQPAEQGIVQQPQQGNTPQSEAPEQHAPKGIGFNEQHAILCWQEYANRIPKEHTAMSQRMRAITPKVTGEKLFTVTVNSPLVKRDMELYVPYIIQYFEQRMGVQGIKMDILVADIQVVQRAYTKPEIYRRMTQRNNNLEKLTKALGLEIE